MTTNTGRLASIELATTIAHCRLAERQATAAIGACSTLLAHLRSQHNLPTPTAH